jgi:hypothetical protein
MFDFRNGKPLMDRLVAEGLSHDATSFVESLKINSITEKVRRNRRVVIKRRNVYGERAADLINFYFRAAGIPIRYLSDVREWRRWEARCFQMLNGDRFWREGQRVPTGLVLIWWNVRTNFSGSAKVNRRFQALRRAIASWNLIARLRAIPRAKDGDLRLAARE